MAPRKKSSGGTRGGKMPPVPLPFEVPVYHERKKLGERLNKWRDDTKALLHDVDKMHAHVHGELEKLSAQVGTSAGELEKPPRPDVDLIERILRGYTAKELRGIGFTKGVTAATLRKVKGLRGAEKWRQAIAVRILADWGAVYYVKPAVVAVRAELENLTAAERRELAKREGIRNSADLEKMAERLFTARVKGLAEPKEPKAKKCRAAKVNMKMWDQYGPEAAEVARASMQLCDDITPEVCDTFDELAGKWGTTSAGALFDLGWSQRDVDAYMNACSAGRADHTPAGPSAEPSAELGLEEFADIVQDTADNIRSAPGRFGTRKVFIAAVWDVLRKSRRLTVSRQRFDDMLVQANREDLLALHRADLVPAMPPDMVKRSEISYGVATFHFVESPHKRSIPF